MGKNIFSICFSNIAWNHKCGEILCEFTVPGNYKKVEECVLSVLYLKRVIYFKLFSSSVGLDILKFIEIK